MRHVFGSVPTRRSLLKALGVGGALIPLLPTEQAKAANTPRRFVFMSWCNGWDVKDFEPTGTETSFSFGQTLKPLDPFKQDLLWVGGLGFRVQADVKPIGDAAFTSKKGYYSTYFNGHHGNPSLLTGHPFDYWGGIDVKENMIRVGGESVDQYIARQIATKASLPIKSLQLSTMYSQYDWNYSNVSFAKAGTEGITPQRNPQALFDQLFKGPALPADQLDKVKLERSSILDVVGKSLERFKTRMGREDRATIDAHLESVRDLEQELSRGAVACTTPAAPRKVDYGGGGFGNANLNKDDLAGNYTYPYLIKTFSDMIVTALKCDLTRVITFTLTDIGGDTLMFPWLKLNHTTGQTDNRQREFHDITHGMGGDEGARQDKIMVDQWFFQQSAYLAQQLKDAQLLNDTALVISNCASTGAGHSFERNAYIVVGSCGGYFKTGRMLKFGSALANGGKGHPHNGMLVGIANAMGQDMGFDGSQFGVPELATELPGLRG